MRALSLVSLMLVAALLLTAGIGQNRGRLSEVIGSEDYFLYSGDMHRPDVTTITSPPTIYNLADVLIRWALNQPRPFDALLTNGDLYANAGAGTLDSLRRLGDSLHIGLGPGRGMDFWSSDGNHEWGLDPYQAVIHGGNNASAEDTLYLWHRKQKVFPWQPHKVYFVDYNDTRIIFVPDLTMTAAVACSTNNRVAWPEPGTLTTIAPFDSFAIATASVFRDTEMAIRTSPKHLNIVVSHVGFNDIQGKSQSGDYTWHEFKARYDRPTSFGSMIQNTRGEAVYADGTHAGVLMMLVGHQHCTSVVECRNDTTRVGSDKDSTLTEIMANCSGTHVDHVGAFTSDGTNAPDTCLSTDATMHFAQYYTPGNQLRYFNSANPALGGAIPPIKVVIRHQVVGTTYITTAAIQDSLDNRLYTRTWTE